MSEPVVIVIEGVDCVGKTTLAQSISSQLEMVYLYTPQAPFSGIRKQIEEMGDMNTRFFYYLSCVLGVQDHIRKTLKKGRSIVIDRYIYSTFAMHKVLGANTQCVSLEDMDIHFGDCRILLSASKSVRSKRLSSRSDSTVVDGAIEQKQDVLGKAQEEFRNMSLHEIVTDSLSREDVLTSSMKIIRNCMEV